MALAVRASASAKVSAPRKVQAKASKAARPAQHKLASVAGASLVSLAAAAAVVAPAEAHNVVMSLAEEPYAAAWISPILVPVTGLFVPALAMSSLFLYIQKEK